jgi:hypothetical protein
MPIEWVILTDQPALRGKVVTRVAKGKRAAN